MMKAILLDCGGVLVAPATGDWTLGPGYEDILGDAFAQTHLEAFRQVRRELTHLIPDTHRLQSEAEEYAMFVKFYAQALAQIGLAPTPSQCEALAHAQTYRDDRYTYFDDVLPHLRKWRAEGLRLGIVSDAPPSTRRTMTSAGITACLDGDTYSSDLGVLKPGSAIYQSTLDQLGTPAESAVFIDDIPANLRGAQALGMRAVQMLRPMPPLFQPAPPWDGPIVHHFAELDALLPML